MFYNCWIDYGVNLTRKWVLILEICSINLDWKQVRITDSLNSFVDTEQINAFRIRFNGFYESCSLWML